MTPSELFKPYTGMTVEGSTEKEREEIYDLLVEKEDEGSKAIFNKVEAIERGFYMSISGYFIPAIHMPQQSITNIPYTEFNQLIEQL